MMNFKRAAIALALVTGIQAHAGIGAHGGVNFASISQAASASYTEMLVGVFYESDGDLLHFQPEFNYVKKGYANYLAVPLLLKVKIETPMFKPYIVVGPAPAFKVEGAGAKAFDLSLDAGGGVEIAVVPTISLLAEVRYSLGLVNINDTATASLVSIKTRGVHILAGLHFSL